MPETREVALGAWAVVLLGVAWRGGIRSFLSTVLLGAAPAVILATMFSDALAPITGLYSKSELEEHRQASLKLERARTHRVNSGGESLDWLNVLVKQLWPHISKYVEDMIRGYEGMIQGYLPMIGSAVKFTEVSMGNEPLRFGPVKPRLVDAKFGGETLYNNGVELEIDVCLDSNVDIVLSSPIASVGIADVKINGTLSVIFRPLISKSPFIGGVEVLFTNPPDIEIDFKGLGNVADMPGIYSAVRQVINDAISNIMVSPCRKAFAISGDPAVDLSYLKCPRPEGLLRITIVKAEKLEGADYNIMSSRTSDPYVEVKIGSSKWRTPVIKKNCNPVWAEKNVNDFFFFSSAQLVHIDVWDEDQLTDDDSLGSIKQYTVQQLVEMGEGEVPFPLQRKSKQDSEPPADARLFIKVEPLRMVPLSEVNVESGNRYVLCLNLHQCDGLPEAGLDAPYTVKLSIEGDSERSLSSKKGWPKYSPSMTPTEIQRIQKLAAKGIESTVIAEILGVDEKKIKALVAERLPPDSNDAKIAEWIKKLEADRNSREVSTNPQFEEVLRLPVPERGFSAVVELLSSAKKPAVVGRFMVQIGELDVVEGPWVIKDPKTGKSLMKEPGVEAKLHGVFSLEALAR